jgi:hypothetical protein
MELSPVSRIASAIPEGVSFFKLKRETISDPFLRKIKQQGVRTVYGRAGRIQRVRLPKKVAKARREALRKYFGLSREFLSQPENRGCKICAARIASGENMAVNRSTEIHHTRGRIGKLLTDTRFWLASCFYCREFPHSNPARARAMGLLAHPRDWNVSPVDGN